MSSQQRAAELTCPCFLYQPLWECCYRS